MTSTAEHAAEPVDPDGLLLSGARALLGVAQRSRGDMLFSVGPDHRWGVRVRLDDEGLAADLVAADRPTDEAGRLATAPPDVPAVREDVASQLARVLRGREARP